jgi:Heavy metal binding domain
VRLALLALVLGLAALGFVLAQRRDGTGAKARGSYVCPMHPEATASSPGECPICGMALVKAGSLGRNDAMADMAMTGEPQDGLAAARLLSNAVGVGLASNLVGYSPSPVRQHVLRYEVYAPAWIEQGKLVSALLYGDQLPTLVSGERALFAPTGDPSSERSVQLARGSAEPWDASMSRVHFELEPSGAALKPGTVGWLKFSRRPRQLEVVPALSVMQSAEGPYVLVFSPDGSTLSKRSIQIGRTFTGLAAVLSGLSARELVASANTFFWDAERRLEAAERTRVGAKP